MKNYRNRSGTTINSGRSKRKGLFLQYDGTAMKALEFKGILKNKTIQVPDNLAEELPEGKDVRVIVLIEEKENTEKAHFKNLAAEQFLSGYSDSDSIYDDY